MAQDDLNAITAFDIDAGERRTQALLQKRELRNRIAARVAPVTAVALLIMLWEFAVRAFNVSSLVLASPTEIAGALVSDHAILIQQAAVTSSEIVAGYFLSIGIGILIALVIYFYPLIGRAAYPLMVASQLVPKVAVAPLFVVWFGFGLAPKVMITFLMTFFPIVLNTIVGLQSIEPEKILLARSMGLSWWATFTKVRLPQALPSVFAGLKIAMTLAVIGAIVGEFVGSDAGLGYLLLVANGNLDTPLVFADIVTLTAIGSLGFALVSLAEHLLVPWHHERRAGVGGEML